MHQIVMVTWFYLEISVVQHIAVTVMKQKQKVELEWVGWDSKRQFSNPKREREVRFLSLRHQQYAKLTFGSSFRGISDPNPPDFKM